MEAFLQTLKKYSLACLHLRLAIEYKRRPTVAAAGRVDGVTTMLAEAIVNVIAWVAVYGPVPVLLSLGGDCKMGTCRRLWSSIDHARTVQRETGGSAPVVIVTTNCKARFHQLVQTIGLKATPTWPLASAGIVIVGAATVRE